MAADAKFVVTIEDCQRWINRLTKMTQSLEKKDEKLDKPEYTDNIRMLYTCAVLMNRLGSDLQQEDILDGVTSLFGKVDVGEA